MRERIIGVWRLLAVEARDPEGRVVPSEYGPCPMGTAQFGPERMMAALGDGRPPAAGESRHWVTYTGLWQVEGEVLRTRVDGAHPADRIGIGSDQVRECRFEGARLVLRPPPRRVRGTLQQLELTWEKLA
ncbi:lipocalin-like domain-containing protein [Roseicella frigidaeris]|nr:lipocalin-like domain-containing protein [Roseicella frigidaeris]